jgi:hypothetical protein
MRSSAAIRRYTWVALAMVVVLVACNAALACPTCKDQLAHDPESANIARGYAYSIVFMLSMPPLIFSSLCAYFYWEVRKARARAAAEPAIPLVSGS